MVGIVLSAEQMKTAPPAVRHWLEQQMRADLAPIPAEAPEAPAIAPAVFDSDRIAACTLPEVMAIFERIRHDGLACRVFLEFGREPVATLHPSPLYALDIADIAAATGITVGNQLVACLNLINSALQVVRADPEATLFAFDRDGRCYVHETTHRALHLLRHDLLAPVLLPRAKHRVGIPITCDPPYRCAATDDADSPEAALST
jgi:hypothetical protein